MISTRSRMHAEYADCTEISLFLDWRHSNTLKSSALLRQAGRIFSDVRTRSSTYEYAQTMNKPLEQKRFWKNQLSMRSIDILNWSEEIALEK